ncbi:MAG: CHASE2 domain-containing protein [bacterium]
MSEPLDRHDSAGHPTARELGARSGRRRVARGVLAVVGALLLSVVTFRTEEFYGLEAAARDIQARLRAPDESSGIVLVTITERDYQELFGARSPLDAAMLGKVLSAIGAGQPRAIGVDLDTSHETFATLRALATPVPIVWARDAVPCDEEEPDTRNADSSDVPPGEHATRAACRGVISPLRVLGGAGAGVASGIVVSTLDLNGTIRHYRRYLRTNEGLLPSFAEAVRRASGVSAARNDDRSAEDSTRSRFIAFRPRHGMGWRLSATDALSLASGAGFRGESGLLHDKIVVVGGTYRAARDEHHTPLGVLTGVDIQAQTIDTELRGGGDVLPSLWWVGLAQFLIGGALVLTFFHFPPKRALLYVLVGFPVVVVVASLLTTGSILAGLPYFLPLFVLVVVHQLYEKANLYREILLEEVYARGAGGHEATPVVLLDRIERGLGEGTAGVASAFTQARRRLSIWREERRQRAVAARLAAEERARTETRETEPPAP